MQIQVNSDKNIEVSVETAADVASMIKSDLGRFEDRITRVEVHLSDQNAGKFGSDDKRCKLEVRLAGRDPVIATQNHQSVMQAVTGAVDSVKNSLVTILGKESKHR